VSYTRIIALAAATALYGLPVVAEAQALDHGRAHGQAHAVTSHVHARHHSPAESEQGRASYRGSPGNTQCQAYPGGCGNTVPSTRQDLDGITNGFGPL
jgi:hypothetical protein